MKVHRLLAIAAALVAAVFISGAAWAQNWNECPATHSPNATARNTVPAGGSRCYDFSGTTDSALLPTDRCENIDALYQPDEDGTNTDSTVQVMCCQYPTASANTCWPVENLTLDGVASTNTEAIYGFACDWLYVNVVANANSRDSRLVVRCNGS